MNSNGPVRTVASVPRRAAFSPAMSRSNSNRIKAKAPSQRAIVKRMSTVNGATAKPLATPYQGTSKRGKPIPWVE